MIEEEKEEDERKLSVAVAAAERMNVLVRQTGSQNQAAEPATAEIRRTDVGTAPAFCFQQEEQFAGLLRDLQKLSEAHSSGPNNTQASDRPQGGSSSSSY